ncbi:translation initiation factor IF-2 [Ureaplasma ceti]|uniref:Translation initiation factor IF-2 n=1 Tax=Ureaplasma ceti TaxID=3119530 RepID=A0ABP9U810_9BACT
MANKKEKVKSNKKFDNRKSVDIKKQIKKVDVGVQGGVFTFTSPLTIEELGPKLNKSTSEIIRYFFMKGIVTNLNTILNEEQIGELCLEYGLDFKIEKEISAENVLDNITFDDDELSLEQRPPIVTIMGHVDHGKTTLLDAIRHSNVTTGEAGGITQHIGAYQVEKNNKKITFIDTPGHEAFTEMRARGANVTDIVVLVVAADDGIKVQTQEAIDHAKSAGVEIIVFVNKMDKPTANPEKVIAQLSEQDIVVEEWGGKTICVKGSALQKDGISELLEAIQLISDVNEYKANPQRLAYGTVIEANLDKGYGPLATVLVQNGTLKKGDYLVVGQTYGKLRMMFDDLGNEVIEAAPSTPVKVAGLEEVPSAGDKFLVLNDEKEAREIANKIRIKNTRLEWANAMTSEMRQQIEDGTLKNSKFVLKADVHGSLEAIKAMVDKIDVDGAHAEIIRSAIGGITETDVKLAQASGAFIVGFNIRPSRVIKDLADQCGVQIKTYDIIYKLKEELIGIMKGSLDPVIVEEVLGEAEVMQTWKHSDVGTICGCRVTSGKVKRNAKVRVIRDGVVIYTSEIATLQHGKNQASEMLAGNECGLTIKNFNDVKEGDVLETYLLLEKTQDEVEANA